VHGQLLAVRRGGVERGCERARRVDDHEVAGVEEAGDVVEVRVHEAVVGLVGDHQPDGVARDAARFGRDRRLEIGRQLEPQPPAGALVDGDRHAGTTSFIAWAW
jgi:hypothetical protein